MYVSCLAGEATAQYNDQPDLEEVVVDKLNKKRPRGRLKAVEAAEQLRHAMALYDLTGFKSFWVRFACL